MSVRRRLKPPISIAKSAYVPCTYIYVQESQRFWDFVRMRTKVGNQNRLIIYTLSVIFALIIIIYISLVHRPFCLTSSSSRLSQSSCFPSTSTSPKVSFSPNNLFRLPLQPWPIYAAASFRNYFVCVLRCCSRTAVNRSHSTCAVGACAVRCLLTTCLFTARFSYFCVRRATRKCSTNRCDN